MARKAKSVKGLSDTEVMEKAEQNPNGKGWRKISTLPVEPVNYKAIAQAAAKHGVVIFPDGEYFALTKKPSKRTLHAHIGGSLVVEVEIPAKKMARTIFVINGRGEALDMPRNDIARYITLKPLFGTVIWLPREYLR